jgi:hypothetical protein
MRGLEALRAEAIPIHPAPTPVPRWCDFFSTIRVVTERPARCAAAQSCVDHHAEGCYIGAAVRGVVLQESMALVAVFDAIVGELLPPGPCAARGPLLK